MSKLKTRVWVDGEGHTRLMMVPPNSTVREMLEMAKTRSKRPDLAYVWLEGSGIDLDGPFEDWHNQEAIFCLTSTSKPPSEDLVQALTKTGADVGKSAADVNPNLMETAPAPVADDPLGIDTTTGITRGSIPEDKGFWASDGRYYTYDELVQLIRQSEPCPPVIVGRPLTEYS